MANPWEKYAQPQQTAQAKPWEAYAQPVEQAPIQPPAAPQQPTQDKNGFGTGVAMGILDPVYGIGQMVPRALSQVTSLGGLAPNPVSRAYDRSAQGIDKSFKATEQNYNANRENPESFDWGRLTGNIASPVNWIGGGPAGTAMQNMSKGKKLASVIGIGAGLGALAPVSDTENYTSEKAKQMALGAGGGLAGQAVGSAAARVLNPKTDEGVKKLLAEGVKLTPGEIAGGAVKRGEDILSSIPLVGGLVKGAQKESIESLNTAAINRSLAPLGKKLPSGLKSGRDAIAYAQDTLGEAYDNLLPKLTGKIDKTFADDMDNLDQAVIGNFALDDADKAVYSKIMDQIVKKRFGNGGQVFGQGIKDIESELGRLSKDFMSDASASKRNLGAALSEAQDSLRSMLERTNPQYADELKNINKGYANFKRVQKAAASVGASEGMFSPAQLQNAIKAADRSKDKSAFARGGALMQDLSEPAKARMQASIPDSGTPSRALGAAILGGAGLSGASLTPAMIAPALAALPYIPGGRKLAEVMLAQRPNVSRQAGALLEKATPYLAAPSAAISLQQGRN